MNKFLDLLPKIRKEEDDHLKRFVDFLFFGGIKKVTVLDKPDETSKSKTRKGKFDYLLQIDSSKKVALEFTQIFEKEEERIRSLQWGNLVGAFKEELKRYLSTHRKFNWSGTWDVETPKDFGATRHKSEIIAKENVTLLINAIERQKSSIELGGFILKLKKVTEEPVGNLYFSTSAEAGFIDIAKDIEPKLREKLPQKNQQLTIKGAERVLILVNRYIFGETRATVSALSIINHIWKYRSFDKIYFEESPSFFILVFSKELRNAWNLGKFLVNNSFIGPFQLWIPNLRNNNAGRLFSIIRKILIKEPHKLLPDSSARAEIIKLDEWLLEQNRFKDLVWLIDRFLNDPDPEEPEKYSGDPKFNYHERIIKGEDPGFITTVLGHLAFAVQKLTFRKNYITKALNYTRKLLFRKNLYVKLQAIIPLNEIAARRQWLDGYGKRPYQGTYKEFHKSVFSLVKLVGENPSYEVIAKWLCYVFVYYEDLSTEEAERVLDALKITDKSGALFVYFGIFRQRQYKDQNIKFDGQRLGEKLKKMIKNSSEKYTGLRSDITWHLWKVLDENRDEFDTLKPFIDLILKQPYQKDIYDDVERIISDWIKSRPDICVLWYKLMLSQISKSLSRRKPLPGDGLWLMYTEEIVEAIASFSPCDLKEIMGRLVNLWKNGAFIGSPKKLFETFKLVVNKKQRQKIKKKFQKWYDSMKKLNPRLEKVDWT